MGIGDPRRSENAPPPDVGSAVYERVLGPENIRQDLKDVLFIDPSCQKRWDPISVIKWDSEQSSPKHTKLHPVIGTEDLSQSDGGSVEPMAPKDPMCQDKRRPAKLEMHLGRDTGSRCNGVR
jgi:hypothetical protein